MTAKELEDFEAFLEPSFYPLQFANGLLLATNDDENELDLVTPMKKLRFDLEECERRMTKVASSNHELLVSAIKDVKTTRTLVADHFGPQLQRLNTSFERVRTGLMEPYDDAVKLHSALKRIQATLNLLRGAVYFVFLVQQLEEVPPAVYDHTRHDLVRFSRAHVNLSKLYKQSTDDDETTTTNQANLMTIALVRDYQSIHLAKRSDLVSQCLLIINNDVAHAKSFTSANRQLQDALVALHVLDPNECLHTLERATITRQTQILCNQLSRALQAPRNFTLVLEEVNESSREFLNRLTEVLHNTYVAESQPLPSKILPILALREGFKTIELWFWHRLGDKFKRNVAATMARGGPIAKNLKIYHEGINHAIETTITSTEGATTLLEAIALIGGLK